jgi:hypothetical protein
MPRRKENTKMRVSTVIKQLKISPNLTAAVLAHHKLKSTDRVEPDKFREMVEAWRKQPVGGN